MVSFKQTSKIEEYGFLIQPTLRVFLIYLLGFSAILRADAFFSNDDLERSITGVQAWDDYGRHLSNFLSGMIHTSSNLTDISPLPQLIGLVLVALSAVIMLHLVTGKRQFSWWELVLTIPVGLSPYFLQNLSYRFDPPYMTLSVLAATLPFLFQKAASWTRIILSSLAILVVTMTYQAGLSVYLVLAIFLGFKGWYEGKPFRDLLHEWLISGAGFVIGVLLFRFVFFSQPNEHFSDRSFNGLIWQADLTSPWWEVVCWRYRDLLERVFVYDMPLRWVGSLLVLAISYLCHRLFTSRQKKWLSFVMAVSELLLLVLAGFWLLPFLEKYGQNPRLLFGVMVAVALLMMSLWQSSVVWLRGIRLVSLVIAWFFLVYAFTYGNALTEHKDYFRNHAQTISQLVLNEVPNLADSNRGLKIESSDNSRFRTARIQHVIQQYPLLERTLFAAPLNSKRKHTKTTKELGMLVVDYLNQPTVRIPESYNLSLEQDKQVELVYQDTSYSIYLSEEMIYVVLNDINNNP